ncbi:MAG TPA: hypothetical protein PKA63_05580 [Oligoflexia bacterium]|nr:hypothetical protein [Oligoflexia bacterium]HMP48120.1 hypothetical protein [Oligoflexia bacterium]
MTNHYFEILLGITTCISSWISSRNLILFFLCDNDFYQATPIGDVSGGKTHQPIEQKPGKTERLLRVIISKSLFVFCLALLWVYRGDINFKTFIVSYLASLGAFLILTIRKAKR